MLIPIMLLATSAHASPSNKTHGSATRAKGSLVGLFSSDDYPSDALLKGETGTVKVLLRINTEGRVDDCKVLLSSLSASLDDATCRILGERSRFEPARDRNGHAVTDRYMQRITWKIPIPEPEQVADHRFRSQVVHHADGRTDCSMWNDDAVLPVDAAMCGALVEQTKLAMTRLPGPISGAYRATLTVQSLVGEGLPPAADAATTVRGAARLLIDATGKVSGCQPLSASSLNGDDASDLCSHSDEARFAPLSPEAKNRGDRAMTLIRTLSFEAGDKN